MHRDLEKARVQGFPNTMVLYRKLTLAPVEDFYAMVFNEAL
jgi:hypothetical protein